MPYRDRPPRRRPRWDQATVAYFALFIGIGVAGIPWPSAAMSSALGREHLLYGIGCALFGVLGITAWLKGWRRGEAIGMYCLAALTVIHGVVIWVEAGAEGAQTSLRLIAAAVGLYAWSGTRQAFGISRAQMTAAAAATAEQERT